MAEILRALEPSKIDQYHPHWLLPKSQQNEIYETVGEFLVNLYELTEDMAKNDCGIIADSGDFLIKLDDKSLASFSYALEGKVA
ncbi:MAG: hypothetical protein QFB86_01150 [Patescibacteria group bacterium]|nr:hypothetical protein [Patescibacteria group bacterium]